MRRSARRADTGFTLLEVLLSSSIFGVVLLIFTAGLLQMFRSASRSEGMNVAQTQLHVAFQRLDQEIRYAAAIGAPSSAPDGDGNWYVEYLSTHTGAAVCTQLRLGAQLQRRTWTPGQEPAGTWATLATDVVAEGQPFVLTAADQEDGGHQRLGVRIGASAGGAREQPVRWMSVTFTALNTSLHTTGPTQCTQHRPTP